MPIYEFQCRACGSRFEAIRPMGDTGRSLGCPSCGANAPEKQVSVFAASVGGRNEAGDSARPSCGPGFG